MKLEKMVTKPRIGLWIAIFFVVLALIGVMATSYNVEIVKNIEARQFALETPWTKIVLGSLGFFIILGALVLFFMKLLNEMRVSQVQAEFLDRISHELRTPLSTITLVSDLLRDPTVEKHEQEKLWKSHDLELSRLKKDVELLLQAGHMRDNKLRVNAVPVHLEKWLNRKWDEFEALLGKNAVLSKTGNLGNGWASIDPTLFEMIFRNLMDNARKFSIHHPVVEVKCAVVRGRFPFSRKRWRIEVIDQGLGFDPESGNFLFRRFSRIPFRSGEFRKKTVPGTGLGLYLSASASKAMGITLEGNSLGEGKGAQFVLEGDFS